MVFIPTPTTGVMKADLGAPPPLPPLPPIPEPEEPGPSCGDSPPSSDILTPPENEDPDPGPDPDPEPEPEPP